MEVRKGKATWVGVKETIEGNIVCDKCGKAKARLIRHVDGEGWYTNAYECGCGNEIAVKVDRGKKEYLYD